MADRNLLFTWQLNAFNDALNQSNLFILHMEFENRGFPLSRSVVIWKESGARDSWSLADFKNKKIYHFDRKSDTEEMEVYEKVVSEVNRQCPNVKDSSVNGTFEGLIDWIRLFVSDEIDIEALQRDDLSSNKLTFQRVYPDLLYVYEVLQEILNSSRESFLGLSKSDVEQVRKCLQDFYDTYTKILNFDSQKTREEHHNLLVEVDSFCDQVRQQLRQIAAYLNSERAAQVEVRLTKQIETQVNDFVSEPAEKLKEEIELSREQREEAKKNETSREKEFTELKEKVNEELLKERVSKHKEIFAEQTQRHQRAAWIWLGVASVSIAGLGVGILSFGLLDVLDLADAELTGVLQNIFKKGSLLTLFYFALNRSLKNYTAQKHLEIVNRHRQNALETFDDFRDSSKENPETHDAVLLAATNAIFDANQTGYLSTKTKGSESTNPIQQVVKAVMPGSSSTKSEN
ncbi:MAG: hypothetical protein OXI67_17190 [Candidatus Poribacteria bacterium]|nr:hypothetical protein [Candidatus Poribacteria bacterium]